VYTLRGIGFYDTTLGAYPSVSVYLDQAPLSFPVLTKLTLFDIERIEVLKGPQGTLFGNNATGGAINYIAAKPTRELKAGVSLDYSRFNTFTTDAYISGPLTENLLGRLAVKVESGNGWQESISRPGDTNGAPKTYAARLLLDWHPFEALRIQTNLNTCWTVPSLLPRSSWNSSQISRPRTHCRFRSCRMRWTTRVWPTGRPRRGRRRITGSRRP